MLRYLSETICMDEMTNKERRRLCIEALQLKSPEKSGYYCIGIPMICLTFEKKQAVNEQNRSKRV